MSSLAGLDRVAATYERALGPQLRYSFSLAGFDPAADEAAVPVHAVWWRDAAVAVGGVGYGASAEQARVGALGETAEHVFSAGSLRGRPRVEGSFAELRRRRGADAVLDPRLAGLPAGADYDDDRPLQWLPMRRLEAGGGLGAEVLVPAEFVGSTPGDLTGAPPPAGGWLTTPVSNGLGAGGSREQAVAHGVLEILQRDGNGLRFRALDAGCVLDLGHGRGGGPDAVGDAATREALERLRAAGVDVVAKLAATDFGMSNVYVVGCAPGDDLVVATACGEAVHPDRDVALRKAVLEFAAARARKRFMHGPLDEVEARTPPGYLEDALAAADVAGEEQRVLDATVEWLTRRGQDWRPLLERTILRRHELVPFTSLPTTRVGGTGASLDELRSRLAAEGFEVLVAEFPPPATGAEQGAEQGAGGAGEGEDVHGVKVVVPGLEVETVAYGRLGERNARRLVEAGRDDLLRVAARRPEGPGWAPVHLTSAATERLGGPAWLDRHALDAVAAGLLPLYREPARHVAQLALAARGAAGGSTR